MVQRVQVRRGVASLWTTVNPILVDGEPGFETDTGYVKFGNGTSPWAALPYLAAPEATDAVIWAGTDAVTRVSPRRLFSSSIEQALTDGATITPNFAAGVNFSVTLAGNRTLANPTGAKSGQSGVIIITQDATGSRTLAYGANWKFLANDSTLSTVANTIDVISYFVRPSGQILSALARG